MNANPAQTKSSSAPSIAAPNAAKICSAEAGMNSRRAVVAVSPAAAGRPPVSSPAIGPPSGPNARAMTRNRSIPAPRYSLKAVKRPVPSSMRATMVVREVCANAATVA